MTTRKKLKELQAITGLEDDEIERLFRDVGWLSDTLEAKGVVFKSLAKAETILRGLDKKQLKALLDLIGLVLRDRTATGTDKAPLGAKPKMVVKLTYDPDEPASHLKNYIHPLDKSCEAGIREIEATRKPTAKKSKDDKTAMSRDAAEGIREIERERCRQAGVPYRERKGKGRWSSPDWEITIENLKKFKALRDRTPAERMLTETVQEGIEEIEKHRRKEQGR